MATVVYLTNTLSDVSGYRLASIGSRSPNATSASTFSATGTTEAGTDIAITDTSGGSTLTWITPPLKSAVTIQQPFMWKFEGLESAAAANAQFALTLASYGGDGANSTFATASYGEELTTTSKIHVKGRPGGTHQALTYSPTVLAAGDRIVIQPRIFNSGTMASGHSVSFYYDGLAGGSGDAYIVFSDTFETDQAQFSQPSPLGIGHLTRMRENLEALDSSIFSQDASVRDVINELQAQADAQGA